MLGVSTIYDFSDYNKEQLIKARDALITLEHVMGEYDYGLLSEIILEIDKRDKENEA